MTWRPLNTRFVGGDVIHSAIKRTMEYEEEERQMSSERWAVRQDGECFVDDEVIREGGGASVPLDRVRVLDDQEIAVPMELLSEWTDIVRSYGYRLKSEGLQHTADQMDVLLPPPPHQPTLDEMGEALESALSTRVPANAPKEHDVLRRWQKTRRVP